MFDEWVQAVNELDTTHLLTYYYGCFFIILVFFVIYAVISITFALITRKRQKDYMDKCTEEQRKAIYEFKNISIFNKYGKSKSKKHIKQ